MSVAAPSSNRGSAHASAVSDAFDRTTLALVLFGLAAAYAPTFWDFLAGRWASDSQGHEGLLLVITAWLIYRRRGALSALTSSARPRTAMILLCAGLMLYVFGRTQQVLRAELVSMLIVLAALAIGYKGWPALRLVWFPLFFLLFVIPLPYSMTIAITGPLQAWVSAATTWLLSGVGYPIGRSGVVITIGQYELLVSTACAGLRTIFILEAMGLMYVNLKDYQSGLRNALMAIMIVPVSFCANVLRVCILVLVTYYLGDDAGRGFVHGFAGIVLFLSALLLVISVDRTMSRLLPARWAR